MNAYELLSEPIKRYIRDKKWESFRPIQEAGIVKIMTTEDNYILSSKTASGKTEAAFLPILSKIDFSQQGVQVLYIAPLIALINDQFSRVEDLCRYMEVTITKWHSEASKSQKDALIKNPNGIILITPESIEAILVNNPQKAKLLFSKLKFIVIDEIHGFVGNDRGLHLQSLLFRISEETKIRPRYIGLSATLGSFSLVKNFFGNEVSAKVLLDKNSNQILSKFKYFESDGKELPTELIKDLYDITQNAKALIFPNTRGRVEELAIGLKKMAKDNNGHDYYFAHHSSVNRDLREFIENFAKTNERYNFGICCTSTLELGVDIGAINLVAQIDSTYSVASLIQRVGRSGRKTGQSNLLLYVTTPWSLLQSLACFELYKEGFIEPIEEIRYPINVLFHQILSLLKESSGMSCEKIIIKIKSNRIFTHIEEKTISNLIKFLISKRYIEDL